MNQVTLTLLLSVGQIEAKVEESEEKSEELSELNPVILNSLSDRQKEILGLMEKGREYSRQEIADALGIKKSRTAQILNELISLDLIYATAATKNRRYVKK